MKNLVVMKFGGTSMGSASRIQAAAKIVVDRAAKGPVLTVVSAMSGITDLLLDTLKFAEVRDTASMESNLQELEQRHVDSCRDLIPEGDREATLKDIHDTLTGFRRIAKGMLMLGERPPRSVDEAVACGEHLSSTLMAAHLRSLGHDSVAINCKDIMITDAVFGNASPLIEPTEERSRARILPLLERGVLPIATGFNGATVDGQPTTLGRGGSDYTASLLAACLGAAELWIWTDVDGIMTADPRLVDGPAVIQDVTYREAAELAYNGAKVLHPRTLAPLVEKNIPAWSKNSFAPEKPGTRIAATADAPAGARAVTSMSKVTLLSIEPASPMVSGARIMARALDALATANAEVLSFSSSSYRQSFCFLVHQEEVALAKECLENRLSIELAHGYLKPIDVDNDVGLLAVVGEGMHGVPGIAGRIFTAISREKINIKAIAQGSSELTIAIIVKRDGLEKAVQAVHAECKMSEKANYPDTMCKVH